MQYWSIRNRLFDTVRIESLWSTSDNKHLQLPRHVRKIWRFRILGSGSETGELISVSTLLVKQQHWAGHYIHKLPFTVIPSAIHMAVAVQPISAVDHSEPPPRKRLRTEVAWSPKVQPEPRLFAPFRALGLVTNHVPFALQTRSHKGATEGPRTHIVTCLGKSWAMWEGGKMGLLFVGEYV